MKCIYILVHLQYFLTHLSWGVQIDEGDSPSPPRYDDTPRCLHSKHHFITLLWRWESRSVTEVLGEAVMRWNPEFTTIKERDETNKLHLHCIGIPSPTPLSKKVSHLLLQDWRWSRGEKSIQKQECMIRLLVLHTVVHQNLFRINTPTTHLDECLHHNITQWRLIVRGESLGKLRSVTEVTPRTLMHKRPRERDIHIDNFSVWGSGDWTACVRTPRIPIDS